MSYFRNFVHISPHAYLQVVKPFYKVTTDPTEACFGCQHWWCHTQQEWGFLGRWNMSSQAGPKMAWQSRKKKEDLWVLWWLRDGISAFWQGLAWFETPTGAKGKNIYTMLSVCPCVEQSGERGVRLKTATSQISKCWIRHFITIWSCCCWHKPTRLSHKQAWLLIESFTYLLCFYFYFFLHTSWYYLLNFISLLLSAFHARTWEPWYQILGLFCSLLCL